jgi:hypothetical protein
MPLIVAGDGFSHTVSSEKGEWGRDVMWKGKKR